jgi:NAD(P)-dependent dehydrogenase (short-subunit alcohol dehydrogenase family)
MEDPAPSSRQTQDGRHKTYDLDRLYDRVTIKAGRIDVLVANAGGGNFKPLGAITEASSDDTSGRKLAGGRNVTGALFTMPKALPLLVDGASIVLTGSTTSIKGTPSMTVDAATKAAIRNLARTWTLELKDRRIRALLRITQEAAS